MEFEWDENKNRLNQQKHGIDFDAAKLVFQDENSKISPDLRKDYSENRWKLLGKVHNVTRQIHFGAKSQSERT
jgi:uncharacterized protein